MVCESQPVLARESEVMLSCDKTIHTNSDDTKSGAPTVVHA